MATPASTNDLETILNNLIPRIDENRVMDFPDGNTSKPIHPGQKGYESARYRTIEEYTLAKLIRKIFVREHGKRPLERAYLSREEIDSIVYFTQQRKEKMAYWTGILMDQIEVELGKKESLGKVWETKNITKGIDFLDFLVNTFFDCGKRIYDPNRQATVDGIVYKAGEVLEEYVSKLKSAPKKDIRKKAILHMRREAAKKDYHMIFRSIIKFPDKGNFLAAVYGRIKNSKSHNDKQAREWAKDIVDMDLIEILHEEGYALPDYVKNATEGEFDAKAKEFKKTLIIPKDRDDKFNEAITRAKILLYSSKPNSSRFNTRFDEVYARHYYDIEDSSGATIVYSTYFGPDEIQEVKNFFNTNQVFEFIEDSVDDHTTRKDKPHEYTFKVRLRKENLKIVLQDDFKELYIPDTLEIQILSMPDMVHKYLTPGLNEFEYKERKMKGAEDATFNKLFGQLQSLSPITETIKSEANRHIQRLMSYLSCHDPHLESAKYDNDVMTKGLRNLMGYSCIKYI
jgi:hypothetical protein